MTTAWGSKYRGSQQFLLVYAALIRAAQERRIIHYREIAALIGVSPSGHHMSREVGQVLGEISEDEHGAGRPMLSAIAVAETTGFPGDGFFKLARQLGRLTADGWDAEKAFVREEQRRVFEAWPALATA